MITDFDLLLYIAEKCSIFGRLESSTIKIASDLNASQQTISRKLDDLANKGLIDKKSHFTGIKVNLNDQAIDILKKKKAQLDSAFRETPFLNGTPVYGIGEGKYYVRCYKKKFRECLSFTPFEGSFNLKIDVSQLKSFLDDHKKSVIEAFSDNERSFGKVDCYKVMINNNIEGALVIPERSSHPEDIIEVIAPVNLRQALDISTLNSVTLTKVK